MRKIFVKVLILLLFTGFTACDDEELVAYARGDAFIVSKVFEQDTVYGLALHAFGYKDFSRVEVTDPDGENIQLLPYNGYTYDYYYEDEDEFYPALPVAGNYSFSFAFTSGETDTDVDVLNDDVLYPAHITKCEYDATDQRVELEWDNPEDADYFVIFMEEADGDLVYISPALTGTKTNHEISSSSWVNGKTPATGTTYTIVINAYMYEPGLDDLNVQGKSITTRTVVWGGTNE